MALLKKEAKGATDANENQQQLQKRGKTQTRVVMGKEPAGRGSPDI